MPRPRYTPDTIDSASVAERIADQLRTAMIDGRLRPGDRLRTEPELAEGFSVSRSTVREALKILRGQGVIGTARGSKGGHFVQNPNADDLAESLGETFALWFDIGDISVAEVDEARAVVERACVRLAAERHTPEDLERMRELVEASAEDIPHARFLELEVAFHRSISDAARNRLLNLPMTAIHIARPRTNRLLKPHDRANIIDQHDAMWRAIATGSPDVAEAALDSHLEYLAMLRAEATAEMHRGAAEIALSELGDSADAAG
ncbi:MAG TPA: FCD domain-containing protein [Acidimicrobiia bacterium]|jgi:DNA-binding FadR family transcriptional regulator